MTPQFTDVCYDTMFKVSVYTLWPQLAAQSFFHSKNNPTYCMLFPNNLNIHTFSCHQKFIKEIWPKLTLQYIFLKYWRFKTAIAESNSDFDKSPDLIRLHAHSINFQNQLLYQVFSFSTEISFHKKIIWTSSPFRGNLRNMSICPLSSVLSQWMVVIKKIPSWTFLVLM